MAIVHAAELKPSKLELIASWLPDQSWYGGPDPVTLDLVGAFRFDDPAGDVGIQVLLVREGIESPIYQVPLTYRSAPLVEAADALIGEMSHSVLGRRWAYDGCHDPVFVSELVRAVLTGDTEVVEYRHAEGQEPTVVPATMHVRGSGQPAASVAPLGALKVTSEGGDGSVAVIRSGAVEVSVPRVLGQDPTTDGAAALTGTWGDGESQRLATVRLTDA